MHTRILWSHAARPSQKRVKSPPYVWYGFFLWLSCKAHHVANQMCRLPVRDARGRRLYRLRYALAAHEDDVDLAPKEEAKTSLVEFILTHQDLRSKLITDGLSCTEIEERCRVNKEFAEWCKSDEFWEAACKSRRYTPEHGRSRRQGNTERTWKEHFRWWCERALTNESLRSALAGLFEIDITGRSEHGFGHIQSWDGSDVTDMSHAFERRQVFDAPLTYWNVSNVTSMHHMFAHASSFNQPLDTWVVSKVTDMSHMFRDASEFNQPLNAWMVSNVTNMSGMFTGATAFNQPLDQWNVFNVRFTNNMFDGAINFDKPLNEWNVANVRDMSHMFRDASVFNQPLQKWNVSNVVNMEKMFAGASAFNGSVGEEFQRGEHVPHVFSCEQFQSTVERVEGFKSHEHVAHVLERLRVRSATRPLGGV